MSELYCVSYAEWRDDEGGSRLGMLRGTLHLFTMHAVKKYPLRPPHVMIAHRLKALRTRLLGFSTGRLRAGDGRATARDRALALRLHGTFEQDLEFVDVHGIHYYVQNGVVTLYGAVRHELDRELLVSLVREIPGVKGVVAYLQLVDPRFQPPPSVEE